MYFFLSKYKKYFIFISFIIFCLSFYFHNKNQIETINIKVIQKMQNE